MLKFEGATTARGHLDVVARTAGGVDTAVSLHHFFLTINKLMEK